MPRAPLNELLRDAYINGYAIPAFNAWTFQDALALVRAAEEACSALIIQTSGTCVKHNGLDFAYHMVENAVRTARIPVAVHLDHAEDLRQICDAIHLGYDSVMYDGSKLDIEENIRNTCIVKAIAEQYSISVEAEIGHVQKGVQDTEVLTTPQEAIDFIARTRIDALAVAVGTRHGMQTREAPLRFDILDSLSAHVDTPLVLHGSSGVRDDDLKRIARSAICKVNIATRLRTVFIRSAAQTAATFTQSDHIDFLMKTYRPVIDEAVFIIKQLGSADRV